jgi:hypothetical protein
MAREERSRTRKVSKILLLVALVIFSAASVIFSVYVLFTDLGYRTEVTPSQARGLFTVFIYDYINEIHPQRLPAGLTWEINELQFISKNLAVVDASDGQTKSSLEFIYIIEYPNVRVLKINDVTGRELQDANVALIRFLDAMKSGAYSDAAALYGGSISRLVPYGKLNAPLPDLLEGYCTKTTPAKSCLPFSIHDAKQELVSGGYQFVVTYALPDGSDFELVSGKSEFKAIVEKNDDQQLTVTTLPFD